MFSNGHQLLTRSTTQGTDSYCCDVLNTEKCQALPVNQNTPHHTCHSASSHFAARVMAMWAILLTKSEATSHDNLEVKLSVCTPKKAHGTAPLVLKLGSSDTPEVRKETSTLTKHETLHTEMLLILRPRDSTAVSAKVRPTYLLHEAESFLRS